MDPLFALLALGEGNKSFRIQRDQFRLKWLFLISAIFLYDDITRASLCLKSPVIPLFFLSICLGWYQIKLESSVTGSLWGGNHCSAPSHYLNQCWNIVIWTFRKKLQGNLNRNSFIFIQENAFENVVWKMVAIFSRSQTVNNRRITYITMTS